MMTSFHKIRILSLASLICLTTLSSVFMHAKATKGSYPGANGMIVFSDRDPVGGDWEIFVMNSDGTGRQQLTTNRVPDRYPCWSPDGEKIAFVKNLFETDELNYISKDGTGLTLVSTSPIDFGYSGPAWSPDGQKIAYERQHHRPPGEFDIYVIQIGTVGEGVKLIENADSPSWSPDGSMIAYYHRTDYNIWVADSSTGAPLFRVTSDGGSSPCWSPDGQRIVYEYDDLIYVIDIDGSNKQQISSPPPDPDWDGDDDPNWSPDGSKIVFGRDFDSIWIMDPDGSNAYDLTPSWPNAMEPDWQRLPVPVPVGGEIVSSSTISLLAPYIGLITITVLAGYSVLNRKKLQ